MKILAENVHVDFNGMGSVLASRGFGYLVANIFAVILQNIVKNHADGILILAFTLPAIGSISYSIITIKSFEIFSLAVFATPFVTSMILMCVLFFIQGLGQGFTDLGK